MSEEMTDHVLSAIVDQIPKEHLWRAFALIEKRLEVSSMAIIDAGMDVFEERIEHHVSDVLSEIGQYSDENQDRWIKAYRKQLFQNFNFYDWNDALTSPTIENLDMDLQSYFDNQVVRDMHHDLILKHYGVTT